MPTIYAATTDNKITSGPNTNYAFTRNALTGTLGTVTTTTEGFNVESMAFSGRGATQYRISRSFFHFDTSGITAAVSSATFKIHIYAVGGGESRIMLFASVAFTGGSNALVAEDFNDYYALTPYSGTSGVPVAGSMLEITLNSDALSDLQDNNDFKVAALNWKHDYSNSTPSYPNNYISTRMADYSGTASDPQIEYTLATTGYGNDVNGVASANIGKVDGVATANIEKIIGV